jgi:fibro-slime domain-containing protein
MELHCNFIKQPGLTFTFRGDDDVWVFVINTANGSGGNTRSSRRAYNLDNISGLVNGRAYTLDVFYAERHTAESHIWITTNIISAPSNLRLYKQPGAPDVGSNKPIGSYDSVSIGQPYTLYGHVFDSTGTWRPEYDDQITWEITSGGILSSSKGASTVFTPTQPGTYTLTARFKDPDNPSKESVSTVTFVC